jgi:hypothetical protein
MRDYAEEVTMPNADVPEKPRWQQAVGKPVRVDRRQRRRDLLADYHAFLLGEAAQVQYILAGINRDTMAERLTITEHQVQYVAKQLAKLDG